MSDQHFSYITKLRKKTPRLTTLNLLVMATYLVAIISLTQYLLAFGVYNQVLIFQIHIKPMIWLEV